MTKPADHRLLELTYPACTDLECCGGDDEPSVVRICNACRKPWPCKIVRETEAAAARQKVIDESMSKLQTIGEQHIHKVGYPSFGERVCVLAMPFEGQMVEGDGLLMWTTVLWEHGGGLSPYHRCLLEHPA